MNYQDAIVTADGGVNMRSSASTSSMKLCVIPKNAKIKAAQYDNDWYAVEYNGKTGYAMAKFISFTNEDLTEDELFRHISNIEKELAELKALLRA
ncbi:MAG: SH3 domain-containing protein [Clostridia bacterium]|nr:SH3 domain-containing protein [Clostridia bacterium]